MNLKVIELLTGLTPIIVALISLGGWMWTFQKWRETVNLKILTNECYILNSDIEDKKGVLSFKQSSLKANLHANDLSDYDALEYYQIVQRETDNLTRSISNKNTIYQTKCLGVIP